MSSTIQIKTIKKFRKVMKVQKSHSQASFHVTSPRIVKELGFGTCGPALCVSDSGSLLVMKRIPECPEPMFTQFQEAVHIKFPALARARGFQTIDFTYFILDFYERGSVDSWKLTPTEKSLAIFALATSLNFLHQNGLVHGHVCPSNILWGKNGEPVVSDFSLHLFHEKDAALMFAQGKGNYVAPEYLLGGEISPDCDVYSFAMVVYEMLYGKLNSFQWEDVPMRAMGNRPVLPESGFYPDLLRRCWDAKHNQRPSMAEVLSLMCRDNAFVVEGTNMSILEAFQSRIYPNGLPEFIDPVQDIVLLPSLSVGNQELVMSFIAANEGIKEFNPPRILQKNFYDLNNPRKLYQFAVRRLSVVNTREFLDDVEDEVVVTKLQSVRKKPKKEEKPRPSRPQLEIKVSLKSVADSGNVEAQYQYGVLLRTGSDGVEKNLQEGARYIKLAADSGSIQAQRLYSEIARNGDGIPENKKAFAHYMKLAAQNGDLESQKVYADLIAAGKFGNVNMKDAAKYYRMAALQGDPTAQRKLAELLEAGTGVTKDIIESVKFYKLAAGQGDGIAQFKLAKLLPGEEGEYYMRISADNGIAEAQSEYGRILIKKDFEKGMEYLKMAIDQNCSDAMYHLGVVLYYKSSSMVDKMDGLSYIIAASDLRNPKATFQYGLILCHMDFIEPESPYALSEAAQCETSDFSDWPMLDIGISVEDICGLGPELIETAADAGLAEAQFFFGSMLQHGDGVELNEEEALKYYRLAADQGHVQAQLCAALLLDNGKGSLQNLRDAGKYYGMAADKGNHVAQLNYAFMLFDGRGVNRNRKEAARYLTSCADAGFIAAQYKLAIVLFNGQGIPKNMKLAMHYFGKVIFDKKKLTSKLARHANEVPQAQMVHDSARYIRMAAEQKCIEAQHTYAWMLMTGEVFPKDIAESMKYFKRAADNGNMMSQYYLALYLSSYTNSSRGDMEEAAKYFKMAADQNHGPSQFQYGVMVDTGEGAPRSLSEAARYYKLAADQGVVQAQLSIANMFENGDGITINIAESAKYYKLAAEQYDLSAMLRYAKLLQDGTGVEKNEKEAFALFQQALDRGAKAAHYEIALAYESGIGVKKNLRAAAKHYKLAAQLTNAYDAQIRYADICRKRSRWHWKEAIEYYIRAANNHASRTLVVRMNVDKILRWIRTLCFFVCFTLFVFNK